MPKDTLVDARGHMLGRLASVLAKQLLNGEQVVRFRSSGLSWAPRLGLADLHKVTAWALPAGRGQNRGDLHIWWSHQTEDEV